MKRSGRIWDVLALASLGGAAGYTASVYGELPARLAVHFDLHGTPNGWMDRAYGTWGLLAFGLVLWGALRFSPRWLPESNGWRERAERSPMAAVAFLSTGLIAATSAFLVRNALHPETSRGAALTVILGVFSLALSAVLPRTRRNPLLGVRTAWSLSSDENWLRANRFGSYSFAIGGVACLACGLAGAPAAGIVAFAAGALAPALYSWLVAYRLPPET